MPERRIVKLQRLVVNGDRRDRWFLAPGSRGRSWLWFDGEATPATDAREAYFELERVRGGWKILRIVDEAEARPPRPAVRQVWPRAPRTLAECRRSPAARLWIVCLCGGRWQSPDTHCRAFDDWTLEALQRCGYWRCACQQPASVIIHVDVDGQDRAVERWTLEDGQTCWMRG